MYPGVQQAHLLSADAVPLQSAGLFPEGGWWNYQGGAWRSLPGMHCRLLISPKPASPIAEKVLMECRCLFASGHTSAHC